MEKIIIKNNADGFDCKYIEIFFQDNDISIWFKNEDDVAIYEEILIDKKSARYLYSCLDTFLKQEDILPPLQSLTPEHILEKPLTYFNELSVRALNIIHQCVQKPLDEFKVKELSIISKQHLKSIPQCGKKTFHQIERFANSLGIQLKK